jgi:NAD(P)-dependent dehydrogenase (short-subunit alcohol dehydrogenase family)
MNLKNQVAMVTGGRRASAYYCSVLGQNGARVAINDVASQEEIEER